MNIQTQQTHHMKQHFPWLRKRLSLIMLLHEQQICRYYFVVLNHGHYVVKVHLPQNIFSANIKIFTYNFQKPLSHYLQFLTFLWASKLVQN